MLVILSVAVAVLRLRSPVLATATADNISMVNCDTTAGPFTITVHSKWAPLGGIVVDSIAFDHSLRAVAFLQLHASSISFRRISSME